MNEKAGFVQGPPDIGTGKRIANAVAILPAGTAVANADGTVTTLTVDTSVFLQKVVISDSRGTAIEDFSNEGWQEEVLQELKKIRRGIGMICGDPFLNQD